MSILSFNILGFADCYARSGNGPQGGLSGGPVSPFGAGGKIKILTRPSNTYIANDMICSHLIYSKCINVL